MSDLVRGVETVLVDSGARPIQTVRSSVIGLAVYAPDADADVLPLNTPVAFYGSPAALREAVYPEGAEDGGNALDAINMIHGLTNPVMVVVRYEEDTLASALGDATQRTGIYAFLNAKAVTGLQPRILCCPRADGYTIVADAITAAPLATARCSIAERLRAIAIIDGPNDDAAAANTALGLIGNKRGFMIDPWVKDLEGNEQPVSPVGAALFNKNDNAEGRGYHWSPSNWSGQLGAVISGTSRPIDFALGDAACEADILAGFHVNTIIREDGFRLWGTWTAQKTDSQWLQITRVRIADIIADSIQAAHLWAVDRPITKRYFEEVTDGVKAFLRSLRSRGIIEGGDCWVDPDLNTAADINLGNAVFSFDFIDHPTATKVTFRYNLNTDYLEAIV